MHQKATYKIEDVTACRDVVVASAEEQKRVVRRSGEMEGGREEELHSRLRMEWYKRTGALGRKNGPTPNNPQCFESVVSLGCLFLQYNTDKGWQHGYQRTYGTVLEEFREKRGVNLLEIGVFRGESLRVWERYFGEGRFFGLGYGEDFEEGRIERGERTKIFSGDQADVGVLEGVVREIGGEGENVLDIIIDDGSHDPRDQIITFEYLFPHLKDGGLYIFEDIETSYWNAEGANLYGNYFGGRAMGVGGVGNIVEKFLSAVNYGSLMNGLFVRGGEGEQQQLPRHKDLISSLQFSQNMIVVRKKDEGDEWVDEKNRPYLFERFTV